MMKINRLTDYATLIVCEMVNNRDRIISANYISEKTKLGQATVVKLLKALEKRGLLSSYRGKAGGYKLEKAAADISILDIMIAVEGGMSLTLCGEGMHNACKYNEGCKVKHGWNKLNRLFLQALQNFTIKDFMGDTAGFKLEKVN